MSFEASRRKLFARINQGRKILVSAGRVCGGAPGG